MGADVRVCVYRHARLEKVKMMRWSLGRALPQHILEQLSAQEKDFFKEYDRCVMKYVHVHPYIHSSRDIQLSVPHAPWKKKLNEMKHTILSLLMHFSAHTITKATGIKC